MKIQHILLVATAIGIAVPAYAKKPLSHDAFDAWEGVKTDLFTNDGTWAAYEVNPQEGDGILTLLNTKNQKTITIPRGYRPLFSADGRWAAALIKPLYEQTRKAKIAKKKDFNLPQDSLAIVNLTTGSVKKTPNVISYKLGKEGGDWVAYQTVDTNYISAKHLKDKTAGKPLVIANLPTGKQKVLKWVKNYTLSADGSKIAASIMPPKKDSTAFKGVGLVVLPDTSFVLIDREKPFYGTPVFSHDGQKLAYTASTDTFETGTRRARLYYAELNGQIPTSKEIYLQQVVNPDIRLRPPHVEGNQALQDSLMTVWRKAQAAAQGDSIFINQYSVPQFSHNGKRLIIGVAPAIAPHDTTIVDFEQPQLDIWRWNAPLTPPQESSLREKIKKATWPMAVDLKSGAGKLICADYLSEYSPSDRWDADMVLVKTPQKQVSRQWDYTSPDSLTVVNIATGAAMPIGNAPAATASISPMGKYVVWFADRNYYAYNTSTDKTSCISSAIGFPLWDELHDTPMPADAYGIAGWTEGDTRLLVYDAYDIWSLDPEGKTAPLNLTASTGRNNNNVFRIIPTDAEKRWINEGDNLLLSVHNTKDKRNGLATLKYGGKAVAPDVRTLEEMAFSQIKKAKDADVYMFQKANFSTSPDVWLATSPANLAKPRKITSTNPQMDDYSWGTARLVEWNTYSGQPTQGVLYTPEGFEQGKEKEYPMLIVFYERNSENLYRHYTMEPSWSWVNYPFYVSRGYVILVPDIHYTSGVPGESCYNTVCSGAQEMLRRYPQIDPARMGIDGQSWGGYQTSYLVTRTNMFACAGSGAPVSNMTSAFGGIRWGTGDSRQAQYEMGQSRIGRNLWENPYLYMANSPIFFADRVETPLLIMHNDADGAVPWYQGIEFFMALRRLEKPVWMLQYNSEAHNIKARKNRKDITIRLQQFFDHYLKGAPMPVWMKTGINPLRKGEDLGRELTE